MPPTSRDAQQRRTLWPMPSGSGRYLETLRLILSSASMDSPLERLASELSTKYGISSIKTTRSYIDIASTLGLVEIKYGRVSLTDSGREANDGPIEAPVAAALVSRIHGCTEILEALRNGPLRFRELLGALEHRGVAWKTSSQIRYRLRWMEECGFVQRGGSGPAIWYELTDQHLPD